MTDPAQGLSVLHVIVRAGPTNSQYNEHVLPVLGSRRITVCSLFPATVTPPPHLTLYQGDGTLRGTCASCAGLCSPSVTTSCTCMPRRAG
jgi:hypothetical protein